MSGSRYQLRWRLGLGLIAAALALAVIPQIPPLP